MNNVTTQLIGLCIVVTREQPDAPLGSRGIVRSVYLDRDGDPKYTIELSNHRLVELYGHSFEISNRRV